MVKKRTNKTAHFTQVHSFVESIFEENLHVKRIESLSNATMGVMSSASFAIHLIGEGLAEERSLNPKHTIKQVDRLLSNSGIKMQDAFCCWVPHVLHSHNKDLKLILDWTDFYKDNHSTLMLSIATSNGRSIPLMWHTVLRDQLNGQRKNREQEILIGLKSVLPEGYNVTILADRGFSDTELYELLQDLGFKFAIRFKGNTYITTKDGDKFTPRELVTKGGRAKTFREAKLTIQEYPVETIVVTWEKDMKEPWCLVSNDPEVKARDLINYYAKRWSTEALFRDKKDLRFGFGMSAISVKSTERRDRLFLLGALAMMLLSILGAAGEAAGLDRHLKANTVKTRTHSLVRQGAMWYRLIPTLRIEWLKPLMREFNKLLSEIKIFRETFSYA